MISSRSAVPLIRTLLFVAAARLIAAPAGPAVAVAVATPVPVAATATAVASLDTPSEVLNFALLDHRGRMHELRRSNARAVVLYFTANGCPVVRQSASKFAALRARYAERGVDFFMVNANSGDDLKSINEEARELGVWFVPVLKDDTQGVARHLGVRRTAEAFVIDTRNWSVVYRGAIDDQSVEGALKPAPTESYLDAALGEFLAGKAVGKPRTVARGCVVHFDGGDGPDAAPVSYANDVAPILRDKCVSCHSTGNIGSWAMTGHRKVKGMASTIEEALLARRMPPWDADPNHGNFANNASLTLAQSQTLLRWVSQGAPRGDGADPLEELKVPPAPEWPMGQPDIVLRLAEPQEIPATGVLDYRHLEVRAGNTNEGWVRALYVKPGNRKILHHAIARLKDGGQKDHLGQTEMYVGWAPGTTQGPFPRGAGKYLPADALFDLELHYTTCGVAQTDSTEVGIYLAQGKPTTRYESVPVVDHRFEIKPGDPDSRGEGSYCFQRAATLHSLTPHMHVRGRWMKFEALFPDGRRETLCSVPRYDFNWQRTYVLETPRAIPAGTWVIVSGGYDNSQRNPSNPDPRKFIHWGEQSWDEMFLGWYNVTWDEPAPAKASASKGGGSTGGGP